MGDTGKLVLLVEDEPTLAALLKKALVHEGFDVVSAANGRDAIVLFGIRRPDIVLSDIRMPDIDGHEFLTEIRLQFPEQTWTPVIMMTAFHDERTRLRALELRADGFLEKPIDHVILVATLNNRLERAAELKRTAALVARAMVGG